MDNDNDIDGLTELARKAEQAEASAESFANLTVIFWNQLVDKGMTREEALHLTSIWLAAMMGMGRPTNDV